MLQKKLDLSSYDYETPFRPPPALAPLLVSFSREVIRFAPADLWGFGLEYFSAMVAEGTPDRFLNKQTKAMEEKQRLHDAESKRKQIQKEKKQAAAKAKAEGGDAADEAE